MRPGGCCRSNDGRYPKLIIQTISAFPLVFWSTHFGKASCHLRKTLKPPCKEAHMVNNWDHPSIKNINLIVIWMSHLGSRFHSYIQALRKLQLWSMSSWTSLETQSQNPSAKSLLTLWPHYLGSPHEWERSLKSFSILNSYCFTCSALLLLAKESLFSGESSVWVEQGLPPLLIPAHRISLSCQWDSPTELC